MGIGSSDSTGVSFNRAEIQSAASKYIGICIIHFLIAFIKTFRIFIEGIVVLHNEHAGTHHSESRACLISVLIRDLIKHTRKLSIRGYIVLYNICENLFCRRPQAKFAVVSVFQSPHFRTISIPPPGFFPKLSWLYILCIDFFCSLGIHFFSYNILYLADGSPAHWHVSIHACNRFLDHARSEQEDMAWDFSLVWNLSERFEMHL